MNKIILISGGSASGKTFVINKVLSELKKDNIVHISMDDFYKDYSNLSIDERKKINFDHPKSMDFKLLEEKLALLKDNEEIDAPMYDFKVSSRTKELQHIKPAKIIIVEGIFALVNKNIRSLSSLNIFINASRENRFIRRLKRDQIERGRTFDSIVNQYMSTVAPMYEEIIEPSKLYADLIINNDDIKNKSIDILSSIIQMMLEQE